MWLNLHSVRTNRLHMVIFDVVHITILMISSTIVVIIVMIGSNQHESSNHRQYGIFILFCQNHHHHHPHVQYSMHHPIHDLLQHHFVLSCLTSDLLHKILWKLLHASSFSACLRACMTTAAKTNRFITCASYMYIHILPTHYMTEPGNPICLKVIKSTGIRTWESFTIL